MIQRPMRAAALAVATLSALPALAHHGWRWTTGGDIEVEGVIQTVKLGNPHGVVTVDAGGETWTVEVGQPWRNERAGLGEGDLTPGVEARFEGEPSADMSKRLMKAERLWIDGALHELYPGRD